MRKKYASIVGVMLVVCMLVALTAVPAVAQTAGLNPAQGPVGTSVTVTATGFAPGSILTATFDGAAVTTAPTVVTTGTVANPPAGGATFALLVPTATAGAHVVRVSDGVNSVTQVFTVQPRVVVISPATKTGPVGTSATVTGTGFAAGFTVNVTVGGLPLASVVSDSAGGFTAAGTIPTGLAAGAQTVTAADLAGNNANLNPDTFTVTPSLAVSPASGLAGSLVTVTGSGWNINDTVTLTFAGGTWTTVLTSATGVINTPGVATPATAVPGVSQVVGTDTAVPANTATTTFTVDPRLLVISPSSGPMGTKVMLQASNMSPNGNIAPGALTIAGTGWPGQAQINIGTAGEMFPTTLVVPAGLTVGANTVRATDNNGLVASGTYTVARPTLALSPITGPRGASATVTGAGWVPNSTVALTFAGAPMTVIADANGNIAAAMTVPATAVTGANTVTANDGVLGNAALPATYIVPGAAISVAPQEGGPGTPVTVSGTGFAGYAPIQITFGGYLFPSQPLSSPLGAFTYSATVPGVAPGSQVVQAFDGTSTATTFFVVTVAPETVETALAGIMDNVVIVWDYAGGDWLFFDPLDPGSDLTGLTAGMGYWINVDADVELIYGGHSYTLYDGWNNIGWLGR